MLIPERGLSGLDVPGGAFHDPEADAALFEAIEAAAADNPACLIRRLPLHINDPSFAKALVDEFLALAARARG